MQANPAQTARSRGFAQIGFGRHALPWFALGAAWTVWTLGWLLGAGPAYWGGMLLTSALWAIAVALDRLQDQREVGHSLAAILRAATAGGALAVAPLLVRAPLEHLNVWGAAMVTALAAQILVEASPRRRVEDLKVALAAAGALVGLPMFAAAIAPLGISVTPASFVQLLAGAAFCVTPTALSLRASA